MNDVAHSTFVTVKRPTTMLPYDFKQAIADLSSLRLIDVQLVAGDHAVVEKRDGAGKDERGATFAADAQAGSQLDHLASKVQSPEPRTIARIQAPRARRVVMRAPREGHKLSNAEAAVDPEMQVHRREGRSEGKSHGTERGDVRARVTERSAKQPVASRPRSKPGHREKQIGGGNDRAALRKERIVVPEIRVSDVSRVGRGYVVRVALGSDDAVRAFVKVLRGAR